MLPVKTEKRAEGIGKGVDLIWALEVKKHSEDMNKVRDREERGGLWRTSGSLGCQSWDPGKRVVMVECGRQAELAVIEGQGDNQREEDEITRKRRLRTPRVPRFAVPKN